MALTDNLVSYWKFDSSNSNDSVGTNNGTDTSVTYSAANGKINNGAGFNGSTSKVAINATGLPTGTVDFSINVWYKGATPGGDGLFGWGATSVNGDSRLILVNGGHFYFGGQSFDLAGSVSVIDGNWHMGTFVYTTAPTKKWYCDGVADTNNSIEALIASSSASLRMGCRPNDSSFLLGSLDEVGVWSRALTGAEVTELYNGGSGNQYPFAGAGGGVSLFSLLGVGV